MSRSRIPLWDLMRAPKKKARKQHGLPPWEYTPYINSDAWAKMRGHTFALLGRRCEVCASKKKVQVHHNNYGSLGGERPEKDLIILCTTCHEALHATTPASALGKRWFQSACSLCTRNHTKQTKYLSCGAPSGGAEPRILRVCKLCEDSLSGRLLVEKKDAASRRQKEEKQQRRLKEQIKKEIKREKRKAAREKRRAAAGTRPVVPKKSRKKRPPTKEQILRALAKAADPPMIVVKKKARRS